MHSLGVLFIYSRRFLVDNKLFFNKDLVISEDNLFVKKALLQCQSVATTDFVHYYYDCTTESLMRTKSIEQRTQRAVKKLLALSELRDIYDTLDDNELKSLLMDDLVGEYLHIVLYGCFYRKQYRDLIDKSFLRKHALTRFNKMRIAFYNAHPCFYYYVFRLYIMMRENRLFFSVNRLVKKCLLSG